MTPPSLTRHDLQPVAMPMLTDGIDEEKLRLFWDACRRPANKGVVRELVSADMNLEDWFWTPESDQSRWARYAVIDPPGGVRVLLTGFAADTNRGTIPLAFKLRRRTGAVIAHCETWGYIAGVKPPREGLTLGTAYLHPAILIEKDSRDVSALGELIIEVALSDMRYTSRIVTLGLVYQPAYMLLGEEPEYRPRNAPATPEEATRKLLEPVPVPLDSAGKPLPPTKQQLVEVNTPGGLVHVKIAGEGVSVPERSTL